MSEILSGKIRDFLASSEITQKVKDPKTHEMIREGFNESFGKVKDEVGDSWEDVQVIYRMAFDDAFDMKSETKLAVLGETVFPKRRIQTAFLVLHPAPAGAGRVPAEGMHLPRPLSTHRSQSAFQVLLEDPLHEAEQLRVFVSHQTRPFE